MTGRSDEISLILLMPLFGKGTYVHAKAGE